MFPTSAQASAEETKITGTVFRASSDLKDVWIHYDAKMLF